MHVMIDLETMGVGPAPAIVSIAGVAFDPDQPDTKIDDPHFHVGVDLLSCVLAGLEVEQATVEFWRAQSDEAQTALQVLAPRLSIGSALERLSRWLAQHGPGPLIWSNGPLSDMKWLEAAYAACGEPIPWNHRQPRCYRTIVGLTGLTHEERTVPTLGHDALADAIAQARDVTECWRRLRIAAPSDGRPFSADHAISHMVRAMEDGAGAGDIRNMLEDWNEGNWSSFATRLG